MKIRQLTYSNVAIRVRTAKRFYDLQKALVEYCGFIWRGRENNPKYEESYDNLVNLFKEDFILFFPNENTIDVVSKEKRFSIEQSGREIIELCMTVDGIEKIFNPRPALIKRFQFEYENTLLPKPVNKNQSETHLIDSIVHSNFAIMSDSFSMAKPKQKKSKLSKKKDSNVISFSTDDLKIITSTPKYNYIAINKLESMLLISKTI